MTTRKTGALKVVLLLGLLLLTACGGRSSGTSSWGERVDLAAFPPGYGRGFAEVNLEKRPANLTTGQPAPDFRVTLNDGRYLHLASLRGRPVIINFWATWCPPCRAEMPDLVRAYETHDDLVILAVNVQEDIRLVRPFADEFRMSMPVVLDSSGALQDLYQVNAMPTSFFVDRDGNIAAVWRGFLADDVLADMLAQIL